MDTLIQTAQSVLKTFVEMPSVLLFALALNVIGWLLKKVPKLNHSYIPVIIIVLSAAVTPFLLATVPPGQVSIGLTNPELADLMRRICIGFVIGFVAWGLHGALLKRIESILPGFNTDDLPPEPPKSS